MECEDKTEGCRSRKVDGKLVRKEKEKKWLAKQERRKKAKICDSTESWLKENSDRVTRLEIYVDSDISLQVCMQSKGPLRFLVPYFGLQSKGEKGLQSNDGRTRFIAEGTETVRLLMQQAISTSVGNDRLPVIEIESVFIKPGLFFDDPVSLVTEVSIESQYHVIITDEARMCNILGYKSARGALACGYVPVDHGEEWAMRLIKERNTECKRIRILALDGISDTANMGSIVRTAAAFGIDFILLSKDCCDPWYRRSIRVSMGHVFRIPFIRVDSLSQTITRLSKELSVPSFSAVVGSSELVLEEMSRGEKRKRAALL